MEKYAPDPWIEDFTFHLERSNDNLYSQAVAKGFRYLLQRTNRAWKKLAVSLLLQGVRPSCPIEKWANALSEEERIHLQSMAKAEAWTLIEQGENMMQSPINPALWQSHCYARMSLEAAIIIAIMSQKNWKNWSWIREELRILDLRGIELSRIYEQSGITMIGTDEEFCYRTLAYMPDAWWASGHPI